MNSSPTHAGREPISSPPRGPVPTRISQRFARAVQEAVGLDQEAAWTRALALFSQMAGALLLSRAVVSTDPSLADEILAAAREDLHTRAHQK
ncbi:hypothetical protein [Streptacidiphilus sp. PB12-B1b]|uniref:hypothetical protein n=1 Tax=Streptacidiphilus sp. PB12-B1b TaxID=2705012 RepID=UPI001CDC5DD7|nr:hypothetical protein [Streptacidiphilus sp. PB12-B1b]